VRFLGSRFRELQISELLFGTADPLKCDFVLNWSSKLLFGTNLSMVAAGLASVKDARLSLNPTQHDGLSGAESMYARVFGAVWSEVLK
jgi:hypothetical protein